MISEVKIHMDNEITIFKDELYRMIECEEIDSPKVLELSQELDILILKYYECCMLKSELHRH